MKKYEFTNELREKAMDIYSNSDLVFYIDENGEYWAGYNRNDKPFKVGSLEDVESFLLEFE